MANVDYLICSFCQGPSSRLLRPKLAPHLSDPHCRIRPSDLDWLDKWRLLVPSHVEWDLDRLQDTEFQALYENELPKTDVVSEVHWVPTIEGWLCQSPDFDDLDSWRTIDFPTPKSAPSVESVGSGSSQTAMSAGFGHLVLGDEEVCSKRTLHAYNDDIKATRLPFHSACLRILYEACNEVEYETYATSTVSDVVKEILVPAWNEGDVSMDHIFKGLPGRKLIAPWGEHWHPLDPTINYFAVDPSRTIASSRMRKDLICQAKRASSPDSDRFLPPILRMPAEVLDLISDFIMDMTPLFDEDVDPRQQDHILYQKSRTFQSLRFTCRQLYHHSFPRAHFLSLLHAETQLERFPPLHRKSPSYQHLPYRFQLSIHIHPGQPPYIKPVLPYRRIPSLPRLSPRSLADRTMDWETIYRGWKQGLGWTNRREMFGRCMVWLGKFQEGVWRGRPWGRTANYAVVPRRMVNQVAPAGGDGEVAGVEEVESEDVPGYLAQFQWPT